MRVFINGFGRIGRSVLRALMRERAQRGGRWPGLEIVGICEVSALARQDPGTDDPRWECVDIRAVLHAHPPTATGFAVAHIPLDRYDMIETVVSLGSIPITPYGTPSTYEVPEAIAPYIQDHDAVLLENHGALTLGADLIGAYYKMETVELFAKINLVAYQLGGPKEISKENIDKLIKLRSYYGVTGRHPGYRHYAEN